MSTPRPKISNRKLKKRIGDIGVNLIKLENNIKSFILIEPFVFVFVLYWGESEKVVNF